MKSILTLRYTKSAYTTPNKVTGAIATAALLMVHEDGFNYWRGKQGNPSCLALEGKRTGTAATTNIAHRIAVHKLSGMCIHCVQLALLHIPSRTKDL